jgi:hypothetical protein
VELQRPSLPGHHGQRRLQGGLQAPQLERQLRMLGERRLCAAAAKPTVSACRLMWPLASPASCVAAQGELRQICADIAMHGLKSPATSFLAIVTLTCPHRAKGCRAAQHGYECTAADA